MAFTNRLTAGKDPHFTMKQKNKARFGMLLLFLDRLTPEKLVFYFFTIALLLKSINI